MIQESMFPSLLKVDQEDEESTRAERHCGRCNKLCLSFFLQDKNRASVSSRSILNIYCYKSTRRTSISLLMTQTPASIDAPTNFGQHHRFTKLHMLKKQTKQIHILSQKKICNQTLILGCFITYHKMEK